MAPPKQLTTHFAAGSTEIGAVFRYDQYVGEVVRLMNGKWVFRPEEVDMDTYMCDMVKDMLERLARKDKIHACK